MPILSLSRVGNNLIVLGILAGIFYMIYTKMDKEKTRNTIEGIKKLFGGKKE